MNEIEQNLDAVGYGATFITVKGETNVDDSNRSRIVGATLTVVKDREYDSKGRGFLVHGGYVLTAAHCVNWSGEGEMALGEDVAVSMIAADGSKLLGRVVAVDPVSDIAVIGSIDDATTIEEAQAFDSFVESNEGLILCKDEFPLGVEFALHIYTHKGEWISGEATQWRENTPTLSWEASPPVLGGTSGSAVVNDHGEVVGVVSTASESDGSNHGTCARPCKSLPMWVWEEIMTAESDQTQ